MSDYNTFYSKLGGYTFDGPALYEPYDYIATVYVYEFGDRAERHCVWTGDEIDGGSTVRILGITGGDSASVTLSVLGVDGLQNAIENDVEAVLTHSSDCIFDRTFSERTTDVRTYCPICCNGVEHGQRAVGLSEDPARRADEAANSTSTITSRVNNTTRSMPLPTVWVHADCLDELNSVLDDFWRHTDEALGELL